MTSENKNIVPEENTSEPESDSAPSLPYNAPPEAIESSVETEAPTTTPEYEPLQEQSAVDILEVTDVMQDENDYIVIPRTVFNYVIIAIVFFIVGTLMGSFVFPSDRGGNELPENFEAVVRDAVADVFEDAGVNVASGPKDGERYEVVMSTDDPYRGNPDAPIVIIEFSDFLCSFCGRFANETLPVLMEEYGEQIRFVYMDFPVINPQASPVIALAAECADDQERFWDYHDLLFANRSNITGAEALYGFAETLNLDMDAFRTCFEEGTHLDEIREDQAYAQELGLRGTPGFFVNGRFINGAVPIETFREVIDEELERLG